MLSSLFLPPTGCNITTSVQDLDPVPQDVKILIAIPTNTGRMNFPVPFVKSLVDLVKISERHGLDCTVEYFQSLRIDQGRHQVVKRARELKVDAILWIDDDMTFGPNFLLQLWGHDKDIVSALYSSKTLPMHYFLWDKVNNDWSTYYKLNPRLQTSECIGTGFLLTKLSVFDKIPYPYFLLSMDPYGNLNFTEDVYFSKMARKVGLDIYVDVQCVCGHLHQITYPQLFYDPNITLHGQADVNENPMGNVKKKMGVSHLDQLFVQNKAKIMSPKDFIPEQIPETSLYDGLITCLHKNLKESTPPGVFLCQDCGKFFPTPK